MFTFNSTARIEDHPRICESSWVNSQIGSRISMELLEEFISSGGARSSRDNYGYGHRHSEAEVEIERNKDMPMVTRQQR